MTIALCSRLTRPVNMLLNSHSEMLRGFAAFNRIIGYLDKENKIVPPVDGVNEKVCDGGSCNRVLFSRFVLNGDLPYISCIKASGINAVL